MEVSAIVLLRLTVYAELTSMAVRDWPHLRRLELADPDYFAADEMELLFGADIYIAILESRIRKGDCRDPIVQQTTLGFCRESVDVTASCMTLRVLQCTLGDPLSCVSFFWGTRGTAFIPMDS